jgi:phosphoribosylformylglycinamidine cyclo-ligase
MRLTGRPSHSACWLARGGPAIAGPKSPSCSHRRPRCDSQLLLNDAGGPLSKRLVDAASAVAGLVSILREIDPGRPSRAVIGPGHYASVLAIDESTGIALCTDGVGTKLIVAEQTGRFDTIGIDCVAMSVNDVVCVGAEPLALVDYIAVEEADPGLLEAIGRGLRSGAERAGIEIPGGELAELPEMIRGHPSPYGIDLVGACIGTVQLDRVITGAAISPGDAVIGLPASGIHSNGLTLARRALFDQGGHSLDDELSELGRSLADELLEPTEIYVNAVLDLIRSGIGVHGLAHITGGGLLNLLRLNPEVGYAIDDPPAPPPIFGVIERAGDLVPEEMYEAFNMGTGFCCIVDSAAAEQAKALLRRHYGTARRIGEVTAEPGIVRLPAIGITGRAKGFEPD